MGLSWWLSGKESTYNAGDIGAIPGLGRSLGDGNGNPFLYSSLNMYVCVCVCVCVCVYVYIHIYVYIHDKQNLKYIISLPISTLAMLSPMKLSPELSYLAVTYQLFWSIFPAVFPLPTPTNSLLCLT